MVYTSRKKINELGNERRGQEEMYVIHKSHGSLYNYKSDVGMFLSTICGADVNLLIMYGSVLVYSIAGVQ